MLIEWINEYSIHRMDSTKQYFGYPRGISESGMFVRLVLSTFNVDRIYLWYIAKYEIYTHCFSELVIHENLVKQCNTYADFLLLLDCYIGTKPERKKAVEKWIQNKKSWNG